MTARRAALAGARSAGHVELAAERLYALGESDQPGPRRGSAPPLPSSRIDSRPTGEPFSEPRPITQSASPVVNSTLVTAHFALVAALSTAVQLTLARDERQAAELARSARPFP